MDKIQQAVRTLLIDHLAATESLTADIALGANIVKVADTSRFRLHDEIYFLSQDVGFAETAFIDDIPDDTTIVISPATVRGWLVSENTYIQKAINNQFIKRINLGDLKVIPSFPTITITASSEDMDWYTLQRTEHNYKFNIRVYVLADNFEKVNTYLIKLAEQIRDILIDHIRPIIDGESHPLTVDLPIGATVVNIADTSNFVIGSRGAAFLRDRHPKPHHQEVSIRKIFDGTSMEISWPAEYEFKVSRGAEIIRVSRLLYDTRPESINYGFIQTPGGGPLMQAADISWIAKEHITRAGNILT